MNQLRITWHAPLEFVFRTCRLALQRMVLLLSLLATPLSAGEPRGIVPAEEADVLVWLPEVFDSAIQNWIDYRSAQGHRIAVGRPESFVQMQRITRRLAAAGNLRSVVIVGDAPDRGHPIRQPLPANQTPTGYIAAEVNVHFGSEPWIATDNPLVDLDDDSLPDLTVGRLAVPDPPALEKVIEKIIAYEKQESYGPWRRRIQLIAGVGGFGAVADSILEMSTRRFIVDGIPAAYDASMTYGSWRSVYCPAPPRFRDHAIDRFNEGCLFWVYIGHGSPGNVAPVETPFGPYPILARQDAERMVCRDGCPIAIFFACYTAAYDYNAKGDCLAESMLAQPEGPVAILGASRVSMPYAMAVLSDELLREYFAYEHENLGELLKASKRASMQTPAEGAASSRALLDGLAGTFSPTREALPQERRENLALFNLIGDPLTRLSYPKPLSLAVADDAKAGDQIIVRGQSPIAGRLHLDVSYRRDRLKVPFAGRSEYQETQEAFDEFDSTYSTANDRVIASSEQFVEAGPFEITISLPDWARGASAVRGFVEGSDDFAAGSLDLTIRRNR